MGDSDLEQVVDIWRSKQELCVFNCLINKILIRETEPFVGETHPAGHYADKPLSM